MSGGYGSKIYRKQKSNRALFLLLIPALILSVFIIFKSDGEDLNPISPAKDLQILSEESSGENTPPVNTADIKNVDMPSLPDTGEIIPEAEKSPRPEMLPEKALMIQNRALAYLQKKQYEEAVQEYNTLLEYDKRYLTIIGICHYRMNENEKAVNILSDADEMGLFPYKTRKFLALAHYALNDLEESLNYAEEASKLGKDSELLELIRRLKREESVMRGYKSMGTGNFLIQFSREEHDPLRTVVSDYLKEAYKEIGKELDYFPNKQFTVILYNERDFFDVTRAPGWAGGLYDGKIRIPVRGITGADERLRTVIFHEYTHALISEITPVCPLWLNEGLAEYFSHREHIRDLKTVIPLNKIEKRFPSGDPRLVALAYATSHDAVEYLIEKFGIYSAMELLENFSEGKSIREAFETVLYITYEDFQRKWRADK